MNSKTNRISIPRTFGMALLGLALSTGAGFAQSPDAQSPGTQARDAHTPDAEALAAQALAAQSGKVRSGEITPLHLVPETLGTSANAVDAWSVHCPWPTHHIHFDVFDFSGGGPALGILAQDFETGWSAVSRAPQGGIAGFRQVNGGSGIYVLHVFKTAGLTAQGASYDSIQECHDFNHNVINHTAHFIFQDQ